MCSLPSFAYTEETLRVRLWQGQSTGNSYVAGIFVASADLFILGEFIEPETYHVNTINTNETQTFAVSITAGDLSLVLG
jgi:hypothetical protein